MFHTPSLKVLNIRICIIFKNPFIFITYNKNRFNYHLVKLNSNIPSTFLFNVQFLNIEIKQIVKADLMGWDQTI